MIFAFIVALIVILLILAISFVVILAIVGGATSMMLPIFAPILAGGALVAIPVVLLLPIGL